jgi:ABC-type transporter Mla MlaB component
MAKPTLKFESSDDKVRLIAVGDWAVQYATEVKSSLMQAFVPAKEIHLDLKEVTALDLSGIQLTYAWITEIRKQGTPVVVSMPTDASLLDLLEKSRITKLF